MFHELVERLSQPIALYGCICVLLGLWIYSHIDEERKVKRLGGRAPTRTCWTPLGLSFLKEGVMAALRDDNLKFWHNTFMRYGNANNPFTIEVNGSGRRIVMTADPENIKVVLATQFNDFGKGEVFNRDWYEFLGDGIFATDGQKWHDSRQLIRPQFIKDRVSDLETFEKHLSIVIPMLGGNGEDVDVKDIFFRFTLDAATDFLLGRSVESLEKPVEFAEAFAKVQELQNMVSRFGPLNWLLPRKELRRHLKTINSFVEPYIDEALALSPDELKQRTKSDSGYTFLHAIASYTRDRNVLRDQLISVLLAGRDTTACTLSWLFFELSRNQDIVARLRREIQQTCGMNSPPTYNDLKSMRYLQHTLNETLRLYPVVPFNIRVALKDTTLPHGSGPDGNSPVGMPKGTPIIYSTHYMQLRGDIYPQTSEKFPAPSVFAPERWESWQPKIWTYIPFNGGPRICVGQQFALTEMGYTVVRILQNYSRIENRIGKTEAPFGLGSEPANYHENGNGMRNVVSGLSMDKKFPWTRGLGNSTNEASTVELAAGEHRGMKMKSEIVLSPADKVTVAFYK